MSLHTAAYQGTERDRVEDSCDADLRQYLHEIGVFRVLTFDEEQILARNIEQGDDAAKQTFIQHNLRLVVPIARHYAQHSRVSLLDLIQEGNLGLLKAVDRFDYHKGFRFSTYATWWIRQSVSRSLPKLARTISLPVHIEERIHVLKKFMARCESELGHEPSYEEIAALSHGRYSIEKITEMLQLAEGTISLETSIDDNDHVLGDLIEDSSLAHVDAIAEQSTLARNIECVLHTLNAKDRLVLIQRFGLDNHGERTLEEVSKALGVVRERIRQRQQNATKAIREPLARLLAAESRE